MRNYGPPINRFLRQVEFSVGCWVWKGLIDHDGYGKFYVNGRTMHVHRWYWMYRENVLLPRSILVLHKCDNRLCVNPRHLFTGTDADNVADKVAKCRQARGERHGIAKLTDEDVKAIRKERAETPVLLRELSARYGVSCVALSKVVRRLSYRHV